MKKYNLIIVDENKKEIVEVTAINEEKALKRLLVSMAYEEQKQKNIRFS